MTKNFLEKGFTNGRRDDKIKNNQQKVNYKMKEINRVLYSNSL